MAQKKSSFVTQTRTRNIATHSHISHLRRVEHKKNIHFLFLFICMRCVRCVRVKIPTSEFASIHRCHLFEWRCTALFLVIRTTYVCVVRSCVRACVCVRGMMPDADSVPAHKAIHVVMHDNSHGLFIPSSQMIPFHICSRAYHPI